MVESGMHKRVNALTETEAAYLAGFIDGEGYVAVRRNGKNAPRPCIQITQKDRTILDDLKKMIGCGYVFRGKGGNYKLEIMGFTTVVPLLQQIIPYIRVKRYAADRLLAIPIRKPGGGSHKTSLVAWTDAPLL